MAAGFKTASEAVTKFYWKSSTYRAHENGQNPFKPDDAIEYARAFNVSPAWLISGNEISYDAHGKQLKSLPKIESLPDRARNFTLSNSRLNIDKNVIDMLEIYINGRISEGIWREAPLSDSSNIRIASPFPVDLNYPAEAQYDLIIDDSSLDGFAREGDCLRCLDAKVLTDFPQDGDLVVAQRRKNDLIETTVKRVRRLGERLELWPERQEQVHASKVLVIDTFDNENEVKIVAKVLWAYRKAV
jgi:hypothetical protein